MQHEMQYQTPPSLGYEGEQVQNPSTYSLYGQKLSMPISSQMAGPGQRLALAIVSLSLLIFLIFGLVAFAALSNAPNWAVVPILFIIALFSAVVAIVNIVFNRRI